MIAFLFFVPIFSIFDIGHGFFALNISTQSSFEFSYSLRNILFFPLDLAQSKRGERKKERLKLKSQPWNMKFEKNLEKMLFLHWLHLQKKNWVNYPYRVSTRTPSSWAYFTMAVCILECLNKTNGLVYRTTNWQVIHGDLSQNTAMINDKQATQRMAQVIEINAIVIGDFMRQIAEQWNVDFTKSALQTIILFN